MAVKWNSLAKKLGNPLHLIYERFLPVGRSPNIFKSMAAFVVFPYSQSQWQLYVPPSFSVRLKIERMNSVLHLVFVFLFNISYFSPLFKGTGLSVKYHSPEQKRLLSVQHLRLTLDDLAARTSRESMVGPFRNGPILKK